MLEADLQWLFLMIAGFVFGIALIGFGGMHVSMIVANKTTIESWERHRYRVGPLHRKQYVNIFHLGSWRQNWNQVMGPDVRYWFIPIGNSIGNGMTFEVNQTAYRQLLEHANTRAQQQQ